MSRVQHLENQVADLERQIQALQTDPVTGIPVRRVFERELVQAFNGRRTMRDSDRYGILMIDIDHFKQFNDEHGHREGDLELRRVAQIIRKHLRPGDVLARYGGEEFVVLVPQASGRLGMIRLAERVRMGVQLGEPFAASMGVKNETTVSVGYSLRLPGDANEWTAVGRADAALYQAKNVGRNCVYGII